MKTQVEIEQALTKFLLEFMSLRASPDEPLDYALTSMQVYEVLVFIETEFGTATDLSEFDGATVSKLARAVVQRLKS